MQKDISTTISSLTALSPQLQRWLGNNDDFFINSNSTQVNPNNEYDGMDNINNNKNNEDTEIEKQIKDTHTKKQRHNKETQKDKHNEFKKHNERWKGQLLFW